MNLRVSARRGAADAAAVLGQQIKAACLARKWTAAELAARIGVDRRTVAAIEAGNITGMPAVSPTGWSAVSRGGWCDSIRTEDERIG